MKQYHDLLQTILDKGTWKDPARENMPRTKAIFGHQMRFDLSEGFPILTTKKVSFKNIVIELLWFLRKDSNIKFMVDNGCSIWNEDAYNYYCKLCKEEGLDKIYQLEFEHFIHKIKDRQLLYEPLSRYNYKLGDTGIQYPKLWRELRTLNEKGEEVVIDQIMDIIKGLRNNLEGRRHILTAWNPGTLNGMALNACHALVQFNCRKLNYQQRCDEYFSSSTKYFHPHYDNNTPSVMEIDWWIDLMNEQNVPQYYLDCQMYQRSADTVLGVPYNIASYSLLTEIFCKILNMVPGEFIHTFGDCHIYEDHLPQVEEQLSRDVNKYPLPKLNIHPGIIDFDLEKLEVDMFSLENYESYPAIKAKLSTGLK